AHRDYAEAARNVKQCITRALERLDRIPTDELLERRYRKFMDMGRLQGGGELE
ncbi:MAG: acetyl-CoA carboxylase carboxyl transferase subunit alpha, partial [Armatimonadota bacterium]